MRTRSARPYIPIPLLGQALSLRESGAMRQFAKGKPLEVPEGRGGCRGGCPHLPEFAQQEA